ncbi:hypothetical protein E2C01_093884 [Portunus trituberculatus]|uniref:Uncharacterized protein n=1 Tax=Portunus trituberculatus TaxID=210409 RepID=A0A5B7JKB3_PORTR|nr:hypothetical protein [Portunus trituberculatus]
MRIYHLYSCGTVKAKPWNRFLPSATTTPRGHHNTSSRRHRKTCWIVNKTGQNCFMSPVRTMKKGPNILITELTRARARLEEEVMHVKAKVVGRGPAKGKKRKLIKGPLDRWLSKEYKKCQNRQPELGEQMPRYLPLIKKQVRIRKYRCREGVPEFTSERDE